MTHASALNASHRVDVDLTLMIDGVPVLFGTRAGLVHPGDTLSNEPTLTSISAFVPGSVSLGGCKLDYDTLTVPPSTCSLSLRIDSSYNRYFERRRTPQPVLTAQMTEVATTLTVNTSSGLAVDNVIYVNREAMKIDGIATNTLTVTRNYCALPGNKAAVHQAGAVVSLSPRHLLGRMAELRIWPSPTASDSRVLKYLRLASSPVYDRHAGAWLFEFDDTMRLFDRRIAVGFRGSRVETVEGSFDAGGIPLLRLNPQENTREFGENTSAGGLEGSLFVKGGDSGVIAPIIQYAGSSPQLRLQTVDAVLQTGINEFGVVVDLASADIDLSMRRCYLFTCPPMVAALQVMLSDGGNQTNHATYDVLFGLTSTATTADNRVEVGETECRFGAAIPSGLVEIPTGTILTENPAGWFRVLGANGEEELLDFLEDVAWALNGYWYLNADQKLAFRQFEAAYAIDSYSATITSTDIIRGTSLTSIDDESNVLHTISIDCNFHPVEQKFLGQVNAFYGEQRETYRDIAGALKMSRKSLAVALPLTDTAMMTRDVPIFPTDLDTLRIGLDRVFARRAYDTRRWMVVLPWKYSTLNVGERVRLTFDQFNTFDGGTASGIACEIVGIEPNLGEGTLTFELNEVFSGAKLIAPTGQVASWSGGPPQVITLASNAKWGGGTTPGDQFAVGWKVKLLDASASPQYSTASGLLTVSAVTSTTTTVTGVVGFTPAAGDLLVLASYDDADSTATNVSQSLYQRQYLFMADANGLLGTSDTDGDVWS